jgi:hypothetical protein
MSEKAESVLPLCTMMPHILIMGHAQVHHQITGGEFLWHALLLNKTYFNFTLKLLSDVLLKFLAFGMYLNL